MAGGNSAVASIQESFGGRQNEEQAVKAAVDTVNTVV